MLRLAPDSDQFRVHAVLDDSPAVEAGLRSRDIITAIDNRPAALYKLVEVQQLFKQKGKEHELVIRRGGEKWKVKIKLRELL